MERQRSGWDHWMFSEMTWFKSQHSYGGSQSFVTLVPGDQMFFSGLCGHKPCKAQANLPTAQVKQTSEFFKKIIDNTLHVYSVSWSHSLQILPPTLPLRCPPPLYLLLLTVIESNSVPYMCMEWITPKKNSTDRTWKISRKWWGGGNYDLWA